MTDRAIEIDQFLRAAGWQDAERIALAGDASLRRYIRLRRDTAPGRAIVMDAPPTTGEDVRPFLRIGDWLSARGFSTPTVFARDPERGLLLLEDLGDDLLARHSAAHPQDEPELYAAAAETLAALHHEAPPDLPRYPDQMAALAATVVDWYAPDARDRRDDIAAAMQSAIDAVLTGPEIFVHRDYHAENLLWLPRRDGPARIGILDFQDAMTGPAEYDLASLIDDPRRPVSDAARDAAIGAYCAATGVAAEPLRARLAVCSVQRSLRIIGRVFTRLALHSGRTSYLRFIPPTWTALQRELRHPALTDLRDLLDGLLPEPDGPWLAATEARAGTLAGRDHAAAPE
ncbi:putative phosphotransferase related to Ser/Thr protein kinases [Jannaschia seosinensis]|uniref:Putative phosphotransferase related to Ser/Thr protein kinases n=1 Tax=Jannaschia seosinensis TaxID=313367 RepID=A0A0M7B8W7_9RHOB|nr:phosphotransferase [Jannaschia seosinensis]CUH38821.1 putative phosphotransferase related to Ser/Thr protein kinases [Jannaschia seosinensis]